MSEVNIDDIIEFVEQENGNLKYTIGNKLSPIDYNLTPFVSYDYLFFEENNEYSFCNPELNNSNSEQFPDKSDYRIYFERIKEFCNSNLGDLLNDSEYDKHIHRVEPNPKLMALIKKIFGNKNIRKEALPHFFQFALYTNTNNNKSPRIFFFIGNLGVIYILFYDPFHNIYSPKRS